MAIQFHVQDIDFSLKNKSSIKAWIKTVVEKEKRIPGDISFVFMSDQDLIKINREFLKHDTYTDIITFDYSEGKIIHGEIMISVERVKENSAKLKTGFEDELHRVVIHGVLHLCGYKDKKKEEKALMRKMEEKYLKLFG